MSMDPLTYLLNMIHVAKARNKSIFYPTSPYPHWQNILDLRMFPDIWKLIICIHFTVSARRRKRDSDSIIIHEIKINS